MLTRYGSTDIPFGQSSQEAAKEARTATCVGFICPDTDGFNYADNVCMAMMITSMVETTVLLNACPGHRSTERYIDEKIAGNHVKMELEIIRKLRTAGTGAPGYLRTVYHKARSLEYKWNMKRHEVSEWKSPYYYERGYA